MKRLLLLAAALVASFGTSATIATASETAGEAEAIQPDPTLMNMTASLTNDLLSLIPALEGPDTRHICMVFGQLDKSYCLYIPLP